MSKYSWENFVAATSQKDQDHGLFELESEYFLEVNLTDKVWMKKGAMIAYNGDIKFEREGMFEHGMGKFLKRSVTGEGTQLTKASGNGKLYLGDSGKKISIIDLTEDDICVNGNDLLAFQPEISWDIKMTRKVSAMMAGGLFHVRLSGTGMVAITTHFKPLTLQVTPDKPLFTDPNATVAWSAGLTPEFKTDINLKTFLGRESGETFQMKFVGEGYVVVQPYEEIAYAAASYG